MTTDAAKRLAETPERLSRVIATYLDSARASDQRKGRDLDRLRQLGRAAWRERFQLLDIRSQPDRTVVVLCGLRAEGLVWDGTRPQRRGAFAFGLLVPPTYPLSPPGVQFIPPAIPFHPHVIHPDHLPVVEDLPDDLQPYGRDGRAGLCCYARPGQWSADLSFTLALVVWHVSRLLTGKVFPESISLNNVARDEMLRLSAAGELPFGDPLPYPHEGDAADAQPPAQSPIDGADDEDIEWIEEEGDPDDHGRP